MGYLFLAFLFLPLLELWLLIRIGSHIGAFNTILLEIFTAFLGAYLARREGFRVMGKMQHAVNSGQGVPRAMLDGSGILMGALLLFFPGFITDAIGFLLLWPETRRVLVKWILDLYFRSGPHRVVIIDADEPLKEDKYIDAPP